VSFLRVCSILEIQILLSVLKFLQHLPSSVLHLSIIVSEAAIKDSIHISEGSPDGEVEIEGIVSVEW